MSLEAVDPSLCSLHTSLHTHILPTPPSPPTHTHHTQRTTHLVAPDCVIHHVTEAVDPSRILDHVAVAREIDQKSAALSVALDAPLAAFQRILCDCGYYIVFNIYYCVGSINLSGM